MTQITGFFSWLGQKLVGMGKFIVGGILLLAIIVVGIIIARNEQIAKDEQASRPEIAQIFEPSIGTPLPPDENGRTQESADEDSSMEAPPGEVQSDSTIFIAPPTGIDLAKPINYYNQDLGFRITLPPYSSVYEQNSSIKFTDNKGKLLALINVVREQDTLENILSQLKLSNEVSNLSFSNLAGNKALKYDIGSHSAYVFTANSSIYYISGYPEVLKQFSL
ncbi:MAG TPA: hypothetical protein PKD79_00090 [Candidatus Doudnabacteria bacterium]|nr:hypothetical protein [Candidatus Doudnabacteria bacterium]